MALWERVAAQFGNPRGILGHLVGFIMSKRRSNVLRTNWAVSLLDLKSTDKVLEIGFGPGLGIRQMSLLATEGVVYGIDRSAIMNQQAGKRNKEGLESGRVRLLLGSLSDLPDPGLRFDKALAVNTFMFWENEVEDLRRLKGYLKPGGKVVIVHQPRQPGAKDHHAQEAGQEIAGKLREAGFSVAGIELHEMAPVAVVGVTGVNG